MTTTPEQLIGTATFRRAVQVAPYTPQEASLSVQFPIPLDATSEYIVDLATEAFAVAKAVVFDQLGLEADGTPIEGVQAIEAPQQAVPAAIAANFPTATDSHPDPSDKRAFKDWAIARFQTHPNEFWDNRASKKTPRSPDLKHKATGEGVWLS